MAPCAEWPAWRPARTALRHDMAMRPSAAPWKAGNNIYHRGAASCMVLPTIRPLTQEEWDNFVAALRRGPTPKQVRAVERAKEIARNITVLPDASTIKDIKRRDPAEVLRQIEEKLAAEDQARKARGVALRGP